MIKIDIDFRNASQEEIDALYRVPGFEAALSHVQSHNRALNTLITIIQPNDQLVEVKAMVMEFMRRHNMAVGHTIPVKPFQFSFLPQLNRRQADLAIPALDAMVAEGLLVNESGTYRLTQTGFDVLY